MIARLVYGVAIGVAIVLVCVGIAYAPPKWHEGLASQPDPMPSPMPTIEPWSTYTWPRSGKLTVQVDEDHRVELHRDGTVTWSEGMDATQAARAFLTAIKVLMPEFFCREKPSAR